VLLWTTNKELKLSFKRIPLTVADQWGKIETVQIDTGISYPHGGGGECGRGTRSQKPGFYF